jgi:hypothetical protein
MVIFGFFVRGTGKLREYGWNGIGRNSMLNKQKLNLMVTCVMIFKIDIGHGFYISF